MTNTIQKHIDINAPIEKVWDALTDHTKFGEWFGVALMGPFAVGTVTHGQITIPGFEHVKWESTTKKMEKPHAFSYTWHPCDGTDADHSGDEPTLVEFT